MTASDGNDGGRTPFKLSGEGRDYSGTSLASLLSRGDDLSRSFFNGTDLTNCWFLDAELSNAEFSESNLSGCRFEVSNLSGCDIVAATVTRTTFLNCDFSRGEWRESRFIGCEFTGCSFDHTTVCLCQFQDCSFDPGSARSLEQRSVYMNTFTGCRFEAVYGTDAFVARNFGVPAAASPAVVPVNGMRMTLDWACRLNNIGTMRVIDLVLAAETLCGLVHEDRPPRRSPLAFLANILSVLETERRISASSLLYLEEVVSAYASDTADQQAFLAAMSVVVGIRSALFAMSRRGDVDGAPSDIEVSEILVVFKTTFDRPHVEVLRDTIERVAGAEPGTISLERLRTGSTWIDFLTAQAFSVATLVTAINLVLGQATILIRKYAGLKAAHRDLRRQIQPARKLPAPRARVPDILKSGTVAPSLAPLKTAVRKHGRSLVELDEPARVTVRQKQLDRR